MIKLGEVLDRIESGKNFTCVERPPKAGEQGVVKISAVTWGSFDELQSKTAPPGIQLPPSTRIKKNDLLISRANTIDLVGACVRVESDPEREVHLSDKVLRLVVPVDLKPWIHKYLTCQKARKQISASSSGNQLSMRNISQGAIRAIDLPLPPLNEQRRIVARIEELTAHSKTAKQALQAIPPLLEKFRQSVLAAAFRGDLTAEWRVENPSYEKVDRLLAQIRLERSSQGKIVKPHFDQHRESPTTQLAKLPRSWRWVKLRELCQATTGVTPLRSEPRYWEGGDIPWITSGALNSDLVTKASGYVTDTAITEHRLTLIPKGSLLVALYGEGKTRGLCSELGFDATTNQAIASLIFSESSRPVRHWIRYFFKKNYLELRMKSSGGVQPNLNLSIIKDINIPLPPIAEVKFLLRTLEEYWIHLDQFLVVWGSSQNTHSNLDASILAKAFRGELVPQDPNDEPATTFLEQPLIQPAPTRTRKLR